MKTITVKLDGNDYKLRGDNEELIHRAAAVMNEQVAELRAKYDGELPLTTIHLLAGLNVAETLENERAAALLERNSMLEQINSMGEYLNQYLNDIQEKE